VNLGHCLSDYDGCRGSSSCTCGCNDCVDTRTAEAARRPPPAPQPQPPTLREIPTRREVTLYTYSLAGEQVVGTVVLPPMIPAPEVLIWRDRVFVRAFWSRAAPTHEAVRYVEATLLRLPDDGVRRPEQGTPTTNGHVCRRCGAVNPHPQGDCPAGQRLAEPHDFGCVVRCRRCHMTHEEIAQASDGYCDSNTPHARGPSHSSEHEFVFEASPPPAAPKYPPDTEYE